MRRRTFLIGAAAAAGGLVLGYRAWAASFDRAAASQVARRRRASAGRLDEDRRRRHGDGLRAAYRHGPGHAHRARHAGRRRTRRRLVEGAGPSARPAKRPSPTSSWRAAGSSTTASSRWSTARSTWSSRKSRASINLQITGGSTAVRMTGRFGMRQVGAAARAMLVAAAAERWSVPAPRLAVRDGVVSDPAIGPSARFGELARGGGASCACRTTPPLKQPGQWRIVGTSPLRARHSAQDRRHVRLRHRLPAARHAACGGAVGARAWRQAARRSTRRRPRRCRAWSTCVTTDRAVAVVAGSWWQARQALDALEPQFDDGGATVRDAADLSRRAGSGAGVAATARNCSRSATWPTPCGARRAALVEADYRVPCLHHAAMEPVNVTAQFADGRLTVWGGEQDALGTKARLMELSGLGAGDVTFHGLAAGGSFGRRIPPSADYLEHLVRAGAGGRAAAGEADPVPRGGIRARRLPPGAGDDA